MAETKAEVARTGFEVYNERGPDAFIDFFTGIDMIHPDFLFYVQEDLPNGGSWHGIEGFSQMAAIWLEAWSEFKVEPREFIEASPEAVLVPVRQRAVASGSGMEVEGEFFYVMLFRYEKIAEIHLYTDRAKAEQVAGPVHG
jgi:ketosteroid isomerase-like protein